MNGQQPAEVRGVPVHPSHDVEENWGTMDPHCPAWQCRSCGELACTMCDLAAGDPLAEPCAATIPEPGISSRTTAKRGEIAQDRATLPLTGRNRAVSGLTQDHGPSLLLSRIARVEQRYTCGMIRGPGRR